jgi:hypothetical protein
MLPGLGTPSVSGRQLSSGGRRLMLPPSCDSGGRAQSCAFVASRWALLPSGPWPLLGDYSQQHVFLLCLGAAVCCVKPQPPAYALALECQALL